MIGKIKNIAANNVAWVILLLLVIVFSFASPNFFRVSNLVNIVTQNSHIIVTGLGVTFIMMSGGLDLSVGYQIALTGVLAGLLMQKVNVPLPLVILFVLVVSVLFSSLNMALSMAFKLNYLMISIGTMSIFQGITYIISGGSTFRDFCPGFNGIGRGTVLGVPIPIIIMLVMFIIVSLILGKTYIGRHVFAIGGNKEAARLAGINIEKTQMFIAMMAGIGIGLGTLILMSRSGVSGASIGPGTEMNVMTGVLLGGVSVRGGSGKVSCVIAGILILALLSNGLQMAGLDVYFQYVAKGVFMILALTVDSVQAAKKSAGKMKKAA